MPSITALIILVLIFQSSLKGFYSFSSDVRDCENIFKNVCAICNVSGGLVLQKDQKN